LRKLLCLELSQKEFERFKATLINEKVKLPTKKQLERKVAQMEKLVTQPMTEVCTLHTVLLTPVHQGTE
jgi:hypothetical protein